MMRRGDQPRGDAHASPQLLGRYAEGDPSIGPEALWSVEAHLEACADCRAALADAVRLRSPATVSTLDRVRAGLDGELAREPRSLAPRHRYPHLARWTAPTLLRWLAMTAVIVLTGVGFDLANQASGGRYPSLVLLLAPVAPLLGVAATWARGSDPAYELVAATPRAGLYLVLRRTLAVLIGVIPLLAGAGWWVDASPARWLVPSLAFTVGALALGSVVGVPRAAGGLALLWGTVVVAPSLASARPPVVLDPASLPAWAALTAVVALVLVVRRAAYRALPSGA